MFIFSYWCWCVSITNEAAEPKFHTRGVAMLWTYKRFGETQIQTILGAGISRFSYPRWDGWSFPFFSVAALMSCRTRCTGWKSGDLAHILEWNIHCGIYKPMHREKRGHLERRWHLLSLVIGLQQKPKTPVCSACQVSDLPFFRNILVRTREMMGVCCSRQLPCCRAWFAIAGAGKEELSWRTS